MEAIVLILSDARGQYIPRDFVTDDYNELAVDHCNAWHVSLEDAEILKNPDNECYWDAWDSVLNRAYYMDGENKYTLHQDGDLWGLCIDRMTNEEYQNFFGDMKPAPNDAYEYEVCSDCAQMIANDDDTFESDARRDSFHNSMGLLNERYELVSFDGAEYGFRHCRCELCDALPGNRFRVLCMNEKQSNINWRK